MRINPLRSLELVFELGPRVAGWYFAGMLSRADARRCWFGTFFLLVAGGLLIWGQTILDPYLGRGMVFVLYWLVCFLFTALAILTALLDLLIVRHRSKREHTQLLEKA